VTRHGSDRRAFLRRLALAGIGAWAGGRCTYSVFAQAAPPDVIPRVVIARSRGLSKATGLTRRRTYGRLLDYAMAQLGMPWTRVARPGDSVGIKVNCLGGPTISTSPELAVAIAERVAMAGVPAGKILIFDREDRELVAAGYELCHAPGRLQVYGTNPNGGGYDDRLTQAKSVGVRLSTIVTEECNTLISVPIAKDHMLAGITGALKNHFGCIASPNKWHSDQCDPYVADLNAHRVFRTKHALAVCDAAEVLYEGGPHDDPAHHYAYDGIVVGVDPVATDRVIWELIEAIREEEGLQSLADEVRAPTYIATAAERKLGVCDWNYISVIESEI